LPNAPPPEVPAQAQAIRDIAALYANLRYAPGASPQDLLNLRQRVREFRL
jgi:hypothetical protein